MVTAAKATIPLLLLGFAASYLDIVGDLMETVKSSLVGIEMSAIDDALQREKYMIAEAKGQLPYPANREQFHEFLRLAFEDRGRDQTKDQFGVQYYYEYQADGDPDQAGYTIASAGPDREFRSDDDIILERKGSTRRMTKELSEISEDMLEEARKEGKRKQDMLDELKTAADDGEAGGDSGGQAGDGEDASGAFDSLVQQAQDQLQDLQDQLGGSGGSQQPFEGDETLLGLGAEQ